jgi:hypothetical protein
MLSTLLLTNSTISGNTADYGGGIYNWGTSTLTNNILTNNNANVGGGIYNSGTWSSNSTISGNTANQVWYIDKNGKSTLFNTEIQDPKYPNIFDKLNGFYFGSPI